MRSNLHRIIIFYGFMAGSRAYVYEKIAPAVRHYDSLRDELHSSRAPKPCVPWRNLNSPRCEM